MESFEIENITREVQQAGAFTKRLREETGKTIIGQEHMMQRLLIGLLAEGHILLEGLPGLAKTLAIKTLSKAVQATYHRIQFTPDLLPADIIGTMIYNQQKGEFSISKGPIFANFILADEINRAPAKVQAALLEAMQERQVTIGGNTYRLQEPFLVLATQNPIEQEGTYPLPEAQTDRFMLKVLVDYPKPADELEIMRKNLYEQSFGQVEPVINTSDILEARKAVRKVYVDPNIEQYIWCQEEPQNQGAWYQIRHRLEAARGKGQRLRYAGRPPSAAPATGHFRLHLEQQKKLVEEALG